MREGDEMPSSAVKPGARQPYDFLRIDSIPTPEV
jgi:hypothetical protein